MDKSVTAAITRIPEQDWVGIKYPQAIWDEAEGRWISDAQVAEIGYTAFTSRAKAGTARLIVRRVKRLNLASASTNQGELFSTYRHHAVFTDSALSMLAAEVAHRDHAIVEQVIADLKQGPMAHCPSGVFTANGAWAVLAAMAFNLTRAAGVLASKFHARARVATIAAVSLSSRNVDVPPGAPPSAWPHEAVVATVERGLIADWAVLTREIRRDPWGPVARWVDRRPARGRLARVRGGLRTGMTMSPS